MVPDSEGRRALLTRSVLAIVFSSLIAARAMRRKSLDRSGAAAGFFVVAIHIAAGYRFGALILAFFFTSSYVTKIGTEVKRKVEADFKEGGQRNWQQVLANSAIATILILTVGILADWEDRCLDSTESKIYTGLVGGIIGHYACCNGDTWSSELGILSNQQPRLITTFKVVGRPGPTVRRISGTSILDNDAVNLVSVLLTTILTAMASPYIF